MARHQSLGDGDTCPIVPEHGAMLTIRGSSPARQHCPDQSHDGAPKSAGGAPATRSVWPLGYDSFKSAVEGYFVQAKPSAANIPDPEPEPEGIDLSALLEV